MCSLEYFEKHIRIDIKCNNLYSKKIIHSDYYYLYNIKTVKKFNLKITSDYIVEVCKYNHTDLLTLLKNSEILLEYNEKALDTASAIGNIDVLEWWKHSGLELRYSESALSEASRYGNINVLEWWKNSGLPLKYNELTMNNASGTGNIDVLEWWKHSGLELRYDARALHWATRYGHINILEWWKNSQLLFVHDESSLGYNIFKLVRCKKNNVNNVNVINCINWLLHDDSLFPRFREVYYGALLMYSIH